MGELQPWWLTIASGVVLALVGAIGKVWAALIAERAGRAADAAAAAAELAEARDQIVELQRQASERNDENQREHRRDLRRFAGLPTSIDPPAPPFGVELDPLRPPVVIRHAPPAPRPRPKKPRES